MKPENETLDTLPIELICFIFRLLNEDDITSMKLVSKRYYDIIAIIYAPDKYGKLVSFLNTQQSHAQNLIRRPKRSEYHQIF